MVHYNIKEESVLKIRIKFEKTGSMKFIGHLDLLRYFQKAMRRAEIPIAYSGGYSPHQIMSFASPLGVGLTSEGEYMDIEITQPISSKEAIRRLNLSMVEGMKISQFRLLDDTSKNAMSIVAGAEYIVYSKKLDEPLLSEKELAEFLSQPTILVEKQTKKSVAEIDLKEGIIAGEMRMFQDQNCYYFKVHAGSVQNIKPELILEALYSYAQKPLSLASLQVHRLDLYCEQEEQFISLGDLGADINE